jgi:RNA polymerase sigma factor CnrH
MAKRLLDHGDLATESHPLAVKAATGDKAAFGTLVRLWQDPMWRVARRYTGDSGESEDIVQGVWVSFWRTLIKAGGDGSAIPQDVGAFLRRATLNACRDWSRRRAVRAFFFRAVPLDSTRHAKDYLDDTGDQSYELATLDHLVTRLPANLKAPLILCAIEGMGQREAALVLGLTPKAVEARVARAKQQLQKMWP